MSSKTKAVGIDSSTKHTAISVFIDGKYDSHYLLSHDGISDVEERIDSMGKDIIKHLDDIKPNMIFIERPQGHGRNVDMVFKLSTILGIVRGWCLVNDAYYETVMPSTWRKYIGIQQGKKKRAELKAESIKYVKETYDIDVTDDEADSICLCGAMVNRYKGETGL